MKKTALLLTALLVAMLAFAQEMETASPTLSYEENSETASQTLALEETKIKRFSLGAKIGIPNIAGLSTEITTPLLGNRVAVFYDYSSFDVNPTDVKVGLTYTEYGANIYFNNKGKGPYVGIGFADLTTDLTFENVSFEEEGLRGVGTASVSQKISTTNLKLGVKTGGRIYFRLELGYGFGDIPQEVEVSGSFTPEGESTPINGTETEEFPSIPGVGTNGTLIGNFGFGISF